MLSSSEKLVASELTATVITVPNGAHAILVEDPGGVPTTLTWSMGGGLVPVFTDTVTTFAGGSIYGQPIPVKGMFVTITQAGAVTVDVVWLLRPI